jgi:hypothetical protein
MTWTYELFVDSYVFMEERKSYTSLLSITVRTIYKANLTADVHTSLHTGNIDTVVLFCNSLSRQALL